MSAEFDTVAEWTADVALDLGPDFHIPAGCRGSGGPATLTWLLDTLAVTGADRMLDAGAGVGGPGGFAAERTGVRPTLAEPEAGACRAARRLFGLPVVQADATALPFATGTFDVAWCLAVLCTTADQATLLSELRRVLTPTGRLGLLAYTAALTEVPDQPDGNNFPTPDALRGLLREAGLRVETMAPAAAFDPEPERWRRQAAAVDAELDRRHHDEPAWLTAQRQSSAFGRLLATGRVTSVALVVRPG